MSAPPQAIAPNPHTNLLNVYIQIANASKMGFQKQIKKALPCILLLLQLFPSNCECSLKYTIAISLFLEAVNIHSNMKFLLIINVHPPSQ
jgi:hypothetical protein